MIHLDYRDARPIYSQIVDNFRNQITAGILQQGDRLPSVRELAAELAINPNTIQRAYRDMEAEGMIFSVPGKGNFAPDDLEPLKAAQNVVLTELDELVKKLQAAGIGAEEICARIKNGGDDL